MPCVRRAVYTICIITYSVIYFNYTLHKENSFPSIDKSGIMASQQEAFASRKE